MKKVVKKSIKNLDALDKNEAVKDISDTDKAIAAYPHLLHKLREISLMVRGGDNWIRAVADNHLISIHDFMLNGVHPEVIVEKARKWGYYVSLESKSDIAAVKLFKKLLIKGTVNELEPVTPEEKKFRKAFKTRALALTEELDPIALLVETVKIQRDRVHMGHDAEIADEKLNPYLTQEITTLNRMTHDLIDKLQRIGVIQEKPIEHVVQMQGNFNSVMELVTTEGQNRMLDVADKFLKIIKDDVIELEVSDDGSFVAPLP